MTRKLVFGLVVIPLGALLIALAVVNRQPAELVLDPFGGGQGYMVEAPFFLFLLCAFALGLLIGGFASWLNQGKWRRTARDEAREARDWRRQADRLERELETANAAPRQRPQLPSG
ncbi:LapA family protein [Methyloceanibacter sp.]|uniref:LapA family protein n=1 Tax=Methyloceanibacter sp. TaxID=1965321 RepID=UPI002B7B3385|nr:LapA family protein [Methyloceanibacter sp.]HML91415.1 LapA family protein [Methyloceanibacter sp.]